MIYSRFIGTGSYFPERVMSNDDFAKTLDTSDEWIYSRTGIKSRHIASSNESTSNMAYNAAVEALKSAGVKAEELDGIIVATATPDYVMPSTAAIVQSRLGVAGSFTFDLNSACSGFIYALHVADGLIRSGLNKTILLIGADKASSILDYSDRSTCVLFGDGAGAVVLKGDNTPGIRISEVHADGSHGDKLYMHGMGSVYLSNRSGMNLDDNLLKMQGAETFKLAVKAMADTSAVLLEKTGFTQSNIDCIIPHQANIRIIEAVAKRFDIGMDKVIVNLDKRGNTFAATIPTALDDGLREGRIKRGDNLLFTAFGGGMSWGSILATY